MQLEIPFGGDETLRQKAERWLREHQDAAALFVRFADEMADRGRRFGINALVERARWEARIVDGAAPDHGFKINNSYAPYIARWLKRRDRRLDELLQTRETRAGDLPAREPVARGAR